MTHLYFGDPSEMFSLRLAQTLTDNGADILEIGIPYSDPVADGPVFQRACSQALEGGTTPLKVLAGIRRMREQGIKQPIYITSYIGPIFKMGVQKFTQEVTKAGAQGIITPDILLEEQKELLHFAKKYQVNVVQFVTPYSSDARIQTMLRYTQGFLYCVSVPGVTGSRDKVARQTLDLVKRVIRIRIKMSSTIPIYVGFGISKPAQVRQIIKAGADGVIIGSAIGSLYEKSLEDPDKALSNIATFAQRLKTATIV